MSAANMQEINIQRIEKPMCYGQKYHQLKKCSWDLKDEPDLDKLNGMGVEAQFMVIVQIDSGTKNVDGIYRQQQGNQHVWCNISVCMNNVRNKTGWEVPCSKDMHILAENFTLVKITGIEVLEILEHWRDMKLCYREICNHS